MDPTNFTGNFESKGGFVFGVVGWTWGDQRITSLTFFLNGIAKVFDQHGREIRGVSQDSKTILFEKSTHLQVVEALEKERVDWRNLVRAGWPQLPYEALKEVPDLPFTPLEELHKIKDKELRKAAVRMRTEMEEARNKEFQEAAEAE